MLKKLLATFLIVFSLSNNIFAGPADGVVIELKNSDGRTVSVIIDQEEWNNATPQEKEDIKQRYQLELTLVTRTGFIPIMSEGKFDFRSSNIGSHQKALRWLISGKKLKDLHEIRSFFPKEKAFVAFSECLDKKHKKIIKIIKTFYKEEPQIAEKIEGNIIKIEQSCSNGIIRPFYGDLPGTDANNDNNELDKRTKPVFHDNTTSLSFYTDISEKEVNIHQLLLEQDPHYRALIGDMEKGLSPAEITKTLATHFKYYSNNGLNIQNIYKFRLTKNITSGSNPRVYFYYDQAEGKWVLLASHYKQYVGPEKPKEVQQLHKTLSNRVTKYHYQEITPLVGSSADVVKDQTPSEQVTNKKEISEGQKRKWNENFELVSEYIKSRPIQGSTQVTNKKGKTVNIGLWVRTQRNAYKKGELSQDRIDRLNSIPGWTWQYIPNETANNNITDLYIEEYILPRGNLSSLTTQDVYIKFYNALYKFGKANNRMPVEGELTIDGISAVTFIRKHQILYYEGNLIHYKREDLAELPGWTWGQSLNSSERVHYLDDDIWNKNYSRALDFRTKNPGKKPPESIRGWEDLQIDLIYRGCASKKRIKTLKALPGFDDLLIKHHLTEYVSPTVVTTVQPEPKDDHINQQFHEFINLAKELNIPTSDRILEKISNLKDVSPEIWEQLYSLMMKEYQNNQYCALCGSITSLMYSENEIPKEIWEMTIAILNEQGIDANIKEALIRSIFSEGNKTIPSELISTVNKNNGFDDIISNWEGGLKKLDKLPAIKELFISSRSKVLLVEKLQTVTGKKNVNELINLIDEYALYIAVNKEGKLGQEDIELIYGYEGCDFLPVHDFLMENTASDNIDANATIMMFGVLAEQDESTNREVSLKINNAFTNRLGITRTSMIDPNSMEALKVRTLANKIELKYMIPRATIESRLIKKL